MSGKFQPAKSDYNKDEVFAKFSIDGTTKVTLSEAVAKDSDDNYITVYGQVELPLVGVEMYGNMGWVFEPCLCKFQIPKKDYANEYKGKKTEVKAEPGMLAAIHLITQHGFDKPFSGMFDFGCPMPVAQQVISGLDEAGKPTSAADGAMIAKFFMRLEPIDKLDKLEGKEIKEYSRSSGYGGGSKAQSEADKLKDRLDFLAAQSKEDSALAKLCREQYGESFKDALDSHIVNLINYLFN